MRWLQIVCFNFLWDNFEKKNVVTRKCTCISIHYNLYTVWDFFIGKTIWWPIVVNVCVMLALCEAYTKWQSCHIFCYIFSQSNPNFDWNVVSSACYSINDPWNVSIIWQHAMWSLNIVFIGNNIDCVTIKSKI